MRQAPVDWEAAAWQPRKFCPPIDSRSDRSCTRSLEPGFGKINITLDSPERLVIELLLVLQPNDRLAFCLKRLTRQFFKILRKQSCFV